MANVDQKTVKGKDANKGEFSEKPTAMAVATPSGTMTRSESEKIRTMADAGYESVEKYAKEVGTQGSAATVIAHEELDNFIGQPFVIVDKQIQHGDYGPFLSLTCVIKTDDVVVINAGGKRLPDGRFSGIPGQLDGIEITPEKPHRVPSGLRRSDYDWEDMNQQGQGAGYGPKGGKLMPGTTYYLDYSDEKMSLFARMKSNTKKPRAGTNGTTKPAA